MRCCEHTFRDRHARIFRFLYCYAPSERLKWMEFENKKGGPKRIYEVALAAY